MTFLKLEFLSKVIGIIFRKVFPFLTFLWFVGFIDIEFTFREKLIKTRVGIRKAIDEIVMRSELRNILGTNDVLKKMIGLNFTAPILDRSSMEMLHEDKRSDDNGRIVGRKTKGRIKRKEKIASKIDVELFKLMNSKLRELMSTPFYAIVIEVESKVYENSDSKV